MSNWLERIDHSGSLRGDKMEYMYSLCQESKADVPYRTQRDLSYAVKSLGQSIAYRV